VSAEAYDYDTQDPGFLDDLRESREAVSVVARWLSGKGYPVVIRPTFERPDSSQMSEYADDGDLEIIQTIEVKRRKTMTFSSKADFPYPTLIVDTCSAYDRKRPKPYAYVILNREMDTAFVVMGSDAGRWSRVTKRDRLKSRERAFYECPLELVREVRIPA
jgi:hypothetical protein